MDNQKAPTSSLPLGDRFSEVVMLLTSVSAADRLRGWSEVFQVYQLMIERDIRRQIGSSTTTIKTVGPGESATDITSKLFEKVADKLKANRLKKRDGSLLSWDCEAGLKKYIDRVVNNLINDSGRELIKSRGLVKDPETGKWIPRVRPSTSQSPVNGELPARSGDRPSKCDSGDFWSHFYAELEHRCGKLLADQFREWMRVWAEETDWHRRWIVLSEQTYATHQVTQEPSSIRVNFGRMLGRLKRETALWDRFLVNFPRKNFPGCAEIEQSIPDILENDGEVDLL